MSNQKMALTTHSAIQDGEVADTSLADNPTGESLSRRNLLRKSIGFSMAALGTALAASYGIEQIQDRISTPHNNFFEAAYTDNSLYVQHDGKLFRVVPTKPKEGLGIDEMVRRLNPKYDNAEILHVRELVRQIDNNPLLSNLSEGKIIKVEYNPKKTIGYLSPGKSYPIPQEINAPKNLDQLLTVSTS